MKVVVILSLNDGSCVSGDDDDDDDARSLKSGLVLPTQIFGLFGPPKKRVNFDKFNQRQKCILCFDCPLRIKINDSCFSLCFQ